VNYELSYEWNTHRLCLDRKKVYDGWMKKSLFLYMALALSMSTVLSGCGTKPSHLEPPPGAEKNGFPHTYPAPATDPSLAPPPKPVPAPSPYQ
jgi:hypothetical protein